MIEEDIRDSILSGIPKATVDVLVEGNRATITVVSSTFAGLSRVKRHQSVYQYLHNYISTGVLHAVTINATHDGQ